LNIKRKEKEKKKKEKYSFIKKLIFPHQMRQNTSWGEKEKGKRRKKGNALSIPVKITTLHFLFYFFGVGGQRKEKKKGKKRGGGGGGVYICSWGVFCLCS